MTTANVTQVKSYQSQTVKSSNTKAAATDDFSAVFEKNTQQAADKSDVQAGKEINSTDTQKKAEPSQSKSQKTDDSKKPEEKKEAVSDKEQVTSGDTDQEDVEAAAEKLAGAFMEQLNDLLSKVEDVLQVSRDELISTMDELGMNMLDLLDESNIPKLAVAMTEGADELSLMTDENLFADVKELMSQVKELVSKLSGELDITPQQLNELLQEVPEQLPEQNITKEAALDNGSPVEIVDETTKEELPIQTAAQPAKQEQPKEQNSGNETFNFAQNVAEQLKAAAAKLTQPQGTTYTTDTQAIMNQVQDALKLIMKDDSTEMEMQLHPASLGNVRVQVAAKDGVITASFTTQNEAVKAALESQIVTLKENMNEQGIKVEAVEVTVASHAFERNLSGDDNASNGQHPEKKKTVRRINLSELSDGYDEALMEEEDIITADMMKQNGNTVDYTA